MTAQPSAVAPRLSNEEWRPVVGYEMTHKVSSLGRVWSIPREASRGGVLAVRPNSHGYPSVRLKRGGRARTTKVHVLVAAAFLGPRPSGAHVRHLNCDKDDKRLANLRYGTPAENVADSIRMGKRRGLASSTSCPQGHPYSPENTVWHKAGQVRRCRTCLRARDVHRALVARLKTAA